MNVEVRPTLECGRCGGDAIEFHEDGLLAEDEGERCMTCGHPGTVRVDEHDGETMDNEPIYLARWQDADQCDESCDHSDEELVP